jgi:hypothetical protein
MRVASWVEWLGLDGASVGGEEVRTSRMPCSVAAECRAADRNGAVGALSSNGSSCATPLLLSMHASAMTSRTLCRTCIALLVDRPLAAGACSGDSVSTVRASTQGSPRAPSKPCLLLATRVSLRSSGSSGVYMGRTAKRGGRGGGGRGGGSRGGGGGGGGGDDSSDEVSGVPRVQVAGAPPERWPAEGQRSFGA